MAVPITLGNRWLEQNHSISREVREREGLLVLSGWNLVELPAHWRYLQHVNA